MTEAEAVAAAAGQLGHVTLLESIGDDPAFGGSWFVPEQNLMHVYAVGSDGAEKLEAAAQEQGVAVAIEPADYSFAELSDFATEINEGRSAEAKEIDAYFAGAEGRSNRVDIVISELEFVDEVESLYKEDPRVLISTVDEPAVLDGCTTRTACGTPTRSGVTIGIDSDGSGGGAAIDECSLGFNAAATDGSRWIVTAGHCSHGTPTSCPSVTGCWGHDTQYIGPMRQAQVAGNLDVRRIRKDNSYWGTGGWIYNPTTPNSPLAVNNAITIRATIQVGDNVCLAAWNVLINQQCGDLVISKLTMGFGLALATLTVAGMLRVPFWRYAVINLVCGFIWTLFLFGVGYFFGNVYELIPGYLKIVFAVLSFAAFFFGIRAASRRLARSEW